MRDENKGCVMLVIGALCLIASLIWLNRSIKNEFADCKGLQGVVNQIWTGERCDEL